MIPVLDRSVPVLNGKYHGKKAALHDMEFFMKQAAFFLWGIIGLVLCPELYQTEKLAPITRSEKK